MYLHVNDEPPKLSDVEPNLQFSAVLEELISSTLEKDPAARPQSVEALLAKLSSVLAECTNENLPSLPTQVFNASAGQEDVSPLFTTDTNKHHGASSDTQDVFIGARAKVKAQVQPENKNVGDNATLGDNAAASLIELSNSCFTSCRGSRTDRVRCHPWSCI